MPAADAFFQIRATRADPPGLASADQQRRATYGAALDQFEELMSAAAGSGARSRPLPLFYALSQAGRAIAAAHAESRWKLRGHGLSAPELEPGDICDLLIHPAPRLGKDGSVDSLSAVAALSGSATPSGPLSLGELWGSLPGACDYLPAGGWRRPLLALPREPDASPLFAFDRLEADVIGLPGDYEQAHTELGHYPLAHGAVLPTVQGLFVHETTPYGQAPLLQWPGEPTDFRGWQRRRDQLLPLDSLTGARWLRPALAGAALNTLMSWWALLFGLSMLARYEPGSWVAALDLDRPGLAAQLTKLLDLALDAVPMLVIAALSPPLQRPADQLRR